MVSSADCCSFPTLHHLHLHFSFSQQPHCLLSSEPVADITPLSTHTRHMPPHHIEGTPSSMSVANIYSGVFWDSKACALCAHRDRSGADSVTQFLEPSLVLLHQSADQSEKSCEDNLPVSSNISKPNSAPKRCYRFGPASVAT